MIPSTFFGLNWPIGIEDTMAQRWGNLPSQCEDWQFGLSEIRVAELARRWDHSLRCGRAKMSHLMMHRTTALDLAISHSCRPQTIREVLLPQ